MTTTNTTPTFEEAILSLETIVQQLESGDVPLETAISLFQQGMELSAVCNSKLATVEKKIQTIVDQGGSLSTKPIDLNSDK